jgi:glycine/serine hydroxymethyltransferase
MNSLTVITEGSHPMASSNTKDKNIFRLANGNYISRMAYVHMVASENMISHRYLSPNESRWVFDYKKVGSN